MLGGALFVLGHVDNQRRHRVLEEEMDEKFGRVDYHQLEAIVFAEVRLISPARLACTKT